MIKKGGEIKVDESDKQVFEEVQKIVEEQEQKLREEKDGPSQLSAVRPKKTGVVRIVCRVRLVTHSDTVKPTLLFVY